MKYNWQKKNWTNFKYNLSGLEDKLLYFIQQQGAISGMIKALPKDLQQQTLIDLMVLEGTKNFAIEGEFLSREEVLLSVRNNLGFNRFPEKIKDKRVEGVTRLMVTARDQFAVPLSEDMLFNWHQMMMEPYLNITKGAYRKRKEPMQIVSGALGKEVVHFEAPPAAEVPELMKNFILWFNQSFAKQTTTTNKAKTKIIKYGPVRAAIAHLYFETIHPFEDGNGRIGRALSEKVLSQSVGHPIMLSLSSAIESSRSAYYRELKWAQCKEDITPWVNYFLDTIIKAQSEAEENIMYTIKKTQFFDRHQPSLNARQEKALAKMFDAGPRGFEGGMSAKKYSSITKISKATATRDLVELVRIGALIQSGKGRSTRYELNLN